MKRLALCLSMILLLSGCTLLVETKTIKHVQYIDSDPFPNCVSCSYGVFQKENGETFKLPVADSKLQQMVVGTHYDIEYETKSPRYPSNKVVRAEVSTE